MSFMYNMGEKYIASLNIPGGRAIFLLSSVFETPNRINAKGKLSYLAQYL